MIDGSLLLRTAGKHPSIQVREIGLGPGSPGWLAILLESSGIPDRWEVSNSCSATRVLREQERRGNPQCSATSLGNQAARCQSITTAIQACCSSSRRSRYGAQPRIRSSIDTSAASSVSGTVKPALTRPFDVSTNTRRRRRCILHTKGIDSRANARGDSQLDSNRRIQWKPAPGKPARPGSYVGWAS